MIVTLFIMLNLVQHTGVAWGQQSWGLDSTFGNGGVVTTDLGCTHEVGTSSVIQQDGKIVSGGWSYNYYTFQPNRFAMIRYNIDGSYDDSFGTNGVVLTNGGAASTIALQTDQKILLSGNTGQYFFIEDTAYALLRYNSNGTLDTSFGINGKVITTFGDFSHGKAGVVVQPDGKIVQSGTAYDSITKLTLVRFEYDGTLDSTFGLNGKVITEVNNAETYSLNLQSDGKLILCGHSHNGINTDFLMIRYQPNGLIDSSFGSNGIVITDVAGHFDGVGGIAIQPDGKILQTGRVDYNNSNGRDFWLLRYNENGTPDNTFGSGGRIITDFGYDEVSIGLLLCSDGKIIINGWISISNPANNDIAIARYNTDGSLDNTFGTGGKIITVISNKDDLYYWPIEQSDGKIILTGLSDRGTNNYNYDFSIVRFASYDHGNGVNEINSINGFQIYPNPSNNIITLETTQVDKATYSIYDLTGRLIQADTFAQKKQINVTSFADGVYVIDVRTQDGIVRKKFIKQ